MIRSLTVFLLLPVLALPASGRPRDPLGDGRAIFTLDENGKAVKVNMRYGGEDRIAERIVP